MNQYKQLPLIQFQQREEQNNREKKYWKKIKLIQSSSFEQQIKIIELNSKRNVLCYAQESTLSFYKLNSQKIIFDFKRERNLIQNFKFWEDGLLGFYTNNIGELKLLNLKQKSLLKEIKVDSGPLSGISVLQQKPRVALGSDKGDLFVYDFSTQTKELEFKKLHKDFLWTIYFQPNSVDMLMTAGLDKTACFLDLRSKEKIFRLQTTFEIEDLQFLNEHEFVLGTGKRVQLFDVRKYEQCKIDQQVSSMGITRLKVTDERLLVSSLDQSLRVLDKQELVQIAQIRQESPIVNFDVSNNQNYLAISLLNHKVNIYQRNIQQEETDEMFIKTNEDKLIAQLFSGITTKSSKNSYQYFNRGEWEKADDRAIIIGKPMGANLGQKDKLIRKFKYQEALVLVLEQGNTKEIISVIEELYAKNIYEPIVKRLGSEQVNSLFKFFEKKIDSLNTQYIVLQALQDTTKCLGQKVTLNLDSKMILQEILQKLKIQKECSILSQKITSKFNSEKL